MDVDAEIDSAGVGFFGSPVKTAPKLPSKGKGESLRGWLDKLMPKVLEFCIEGMDIQVQELAQAVGMKTPNYVGTALGHGRGGLQMWKSGSDIKACRENVLICANYLCPNGDEATKAKKIADLLKIDVPELLDKLAKLPIASQS